MREPVAVEEQGRAQPTVARALREAAAPRQQFARVRPATPSHALALQRAAGNRAVGRMLQRCGAGGCTCGGSCKSRHGALRMSHPHDEAEREAELLSQRIAAGGRLARAVQRRVAEGSLPVPASVESGIAEASGRGAPLDSGRRATMERAFGVPLDHVRIHSGPEAASLARQVDAEAFAVGADIFMGSDRAARDDAVLAHELVHVVHHADGLHRQTLYRLSPKMCCANSDCRTPDVAGSGAAPTSWKLILAVDREEEGLGRLISANVGHTWVKLEDDTGEKYSYGMWPQHGFDASRPWKSVAGCIHHPDTTHDPPAATEYREIDYTLTKANYDKALDFAEAECKRNPDYNLFRYNCTTFAIEVAKAAGVTPPSSTTLAIHNPNALFEGIEEDLEARKKAAKKAGKKSSGGGVPQSKADRPVPEPVP